MITRTQSPRAFRFAISAQGYSGIIAPFSRKMWDSSLLCAPMLEITTERDCLIGGSKLLEKDQSTNDLHEKYS